MVPDNGIIDASDSRLDVFAAHMTSSQDVYEIRPRKDRRGFDLIGDRLPLGLLWFEGLDAIGDAVNYARFFSRSHPAIIRVLDDSGTVAETLELAGDCSRVVSINSVRHGCAAMVARATPVQRQAFFL
jgi:hypothetical protein